VPSDVVLASDGARASSVPNRPLSSTATGLVFPITASDARATSDVLRASHGGIPSDGDLAADAVTAAGLFNARDIRWWYL
jgi:hypothetical protein